MHLTDSGSKRGSNALDHYHDLLGKNAIHPEVRGSKVVTEKHTLFSTIIMSRIYHGRMLLRKVTRDIRAKDTQILAKLCHQRMCDVVLVL
jgi:hypothetical protein